MNLYSVHCGFYDSEVCEGIYESHVNLFVVAEDFADARRRVKLLPEFKNKRMHVDGLQEISVVQGYRLVLELNERLNGTTMVSSERHHELAPSPLAT